MRCASLGLIAAFSAAGCSQGPVASPPAPGVPLSNVLNEIKQELAEYNREAAAEPISSSECNGRQPVSMSLTSVRAEVQSTLVDQVGKDVGAQIVARRYPGPHQPAILGEQAVPSRTGTPTVLNSSMCRQLARAPPWRRTPQCRKT